LRGTIVQFFAWIPVLRQAAHPESAAFTPGRSRYRFFIDGTEITFRSK
jgi:hypothetical protein